MTTLLAIMAASCAVAAIIAMQHGTPLGVAAALLLAMALGITAVLV